MARQVWNRALAEPRARHARGERYASCVDMAKWLTSWRNAPETSWPSECPLHTQQQVLERLDETCKRYVEKRGGFPKFKKFGDEPGLRFPDPKQFELDQVNTRIKLPKLGWLRLRQSQPVAGGLRNITVRREGDSQKAGLNRGLLDAAWGEFARQVAYKLEWRGGRVILVNPAYTSRTCRLCLHESAENRKTQGVFSCVARGHTENADGHAAKSLRAAGHAVGLGERTLSAPATDACGGVVRRPRRASARVAAPAKQEPTEAKALA